MRWDVIVLLAADAIAVVAVVILFLIPPLIAGALF